MIMDKLKTTLSKEHLFDAAAVFMGYVIAIVAIEYLSPMLASVIPGEQFDKVITALVVVVVIGLIPVKSKMLTLGATVVLINQIFLAMNINILATIQSWVPAVPPTVPA